MDELARPAIEAVTGGRVRFHPERWTRVYLDWMENIRPWCISRQLWWGHRIPVWLLPVHECNRIPDSIFDEYFKAMGVTEKRASQVNSAPLRETTKQHAMVCSFITSAEYQLRFSAIVTHFNSECQ